MRNGGHVRADMPKIRITQSAKSLATSGVASANNHIASAEAPDSKAGPLGCPVTPSHDQIVGAESGMIKPPDRPDD